MRPIPSPAPAKAGFGIHLSPQATTAALLPPPPSAKCDFNECPWWPYSNSKDFKANTALVLVFLFCTLICGLAFKSGIRYLCMRRRWRGWPQTWTSEDRKAELGRDTEEPERKVQALVYMEGMRLAGAESECAICLSEFAVGDRIRVLERCSHSFHTQCVEPWLVSRSSCPTCRANPQ